MTRAGRADSTPPASPARASPRPRRRHGEGRAGVICPTPLGVGVNTKLDVLRRHERRDPTAGVIVRFPEHKGPVTLSFDLHNRHTYSEEQVKANRAYRPLHGDRRCADDGQHADQPRGGAERVPEGDRLRRSHRRRRRSGAASKPSARPGTESISITIPEDEMPVSILGEKLTVERLDGTATYTSPGRPIAVISNVMIEYRPRRRPSRAARRSEEALKTKGRRLLAGPRAGA